MIEAFRNRKSVIAEFKEEFEQLIDNALSQDTDFVILLACTNCMALFEQQYLQKMVLKVFRLRNRWLNDIVIQNCRIFDRLDSRIEMRFTNYFFEMNIHTFLERFRNTQFSLSLSRNFQYIKAIHFMLFLLYISGIVITFATGLFVLVYFNQYITFIMQFIEKKHVEDLMEISIQINEIAMREGNIYLELPLIMLSSLMPLEFMHNMSVRSFANPKFIFYPIILLILPMIIRPINEIFAYIMAGIILIIFLSLWLTVVFHRICYIFKQKKSINLNYSRNNGINC